MQHRKLILLCLLLLNSLTCIYGINNKINIAFDMMRRGEIAQGFSILNTAANNNDVEAQYYVATCFLYGVGVKKDRTQAFRLFRRAAERGLPDAMYRLYLCYRDGIGIDPDARKSKYWLKRYEEKASSIKLTDIRDLVGSTNPNQNIAHCDILHTEKELDSPIPSELHIYSSLQRPNFDARSFGDNIIVNTHSFVSDVDEDIVISSITNGNTFVLIIANENYQDAINVQYAHNDGNSFREYCLKTLGIPKDNIHFLKDATLNNIKREINLLKKIGTAFNGDINFILYYAGHGLPDNKSKDAYIMPIDGYASDMSTCLSLNDLYLLLSSVPCERVTIFIDACFSGSLRGDGMISEARAVAMKPKEASISGNIIVFTASSGDETAFPLPEQQHGMFTYYLLKKLKESKGKATIQEIYEYVKDAVVKQSLILNQQQQTPKIHVSSSIKDGWQNMQLK